MTIKDQLGNTLTIEGKNMVPQIKRALDRIKKGKARVLRIYSSNTGDAKPIEITLKAYALAYDRTMQTMQLGEVKVVYSRVFRHMGKYKRLENFALSNATKPNGKEI